MNVKNIVSIAFLLLVIVFSGRYVVKEVANLSGLAPKNLAEVSTSVSLAIGDTISLNAIANVTEESGALIGTRNKGAKGTVVSGPKSGDIKKWKIDFNEGIDGWVVETYLTKTGSTVVAPTTPTISISASPASITSGQSSTLTWSSTNATSCTASGAWSGTQATSGTSAVSPTATSTYDLSCTGNGGSVSGSATVSVTFPAPTVSLSASPSSITSGSSSTLTWSSTDATSCTASGAWSGTQATSGTKTVTPTANATYTLDCTGNGGSVSTSSSVTVSAPATPPASTKFKIGDGVKTTTAVNIRSSSTGSKIGTQASGATGKVIGGPATNLEGISYWQIDFANAPDGWVVETYLTKTTTTTPAPTPTPLPTVSISASPASITSGQSSTLTWSSTNATSCTASGAWSGTQATSGTSAVSPTATSTYSLSCTGSGGSASGSTTLNVASQNNSSVFKAGDSIQTTSSVNVRDAANGNTTGTQVNGASGTILGGGTYAGGYYWWNVDYANTPDGWSAENFLTKYTAPGVLPTVSISASPASITSGQSSTLTWSSTNATSCTASGAWSGTQATSGTLTVAPTMNAIYKLDCTGAGGTTTNSTKVSVGSVILPPPPPTGGVSLTPANLLPAYGPLVRASSNPVVPEIATLDSLFNKYELSHYNKYIAGGPTKTAAIGYNHYGFLGSRLAYAIRNGLPYGSNVTDETTDMYARGKRIANDWLQNYAIPNNYSGIAQWQNTSLEDMEALVVLENNQIARNHIHSSAGTGTGTGAYYTLHASSSDPRGVTLYLQPMMVAHRLGIPFAKPGNGYTAGFDANLGSWVNAAKRNIYWLDQYNAIQSDGTIISPSHKGAEAFFMSAMLVDQLLNYYAYIERDANIFAMAQRAVDHWINYLPAGWDTLPYQSITTSTGSSTSQTPDLAAFYVYPSLVMWQETGQQKYYDFAMKNMKSATKSYVQGYKQFNQIFNTDIFASEALISGVHWKPASPPFPPANKTTVAFYPDGRSLVGGVPTVTKGSSMKMTWSTVNATSCTASGGWSGTQAVSGITSISPTVNTTYTINCTGPYGTATQSFTVKVI